MGHGASDEEEEDVAKWAGPFVAGPLAVVDWDAGSLN